MMLRALFLSLLLALSLFCASLPEIRKIEVSDGAVVLKLSKPLLSTPKKASLELPDKSKLRFYFDFGATLFADKREFSTNFGSVKAAQFDKQTVRVVIIADKESKFTLSESSKEVVINISYPSKTKVAKEQPKVSIDKMIQIVDSSANKGDDKEEIKKDTSSDKIPVLSAKKKIIVLDAGHGGKDPGASAQGIKEKDIVLTTTLMLANMLEKKGYTVYLTRSSDIFIELRDRTHFANLKNADLFISIHANAIDPRSNPKKFSGIETYFLSPARSEKAKKAAEKENAVGDMDVFSKETFLNFLNREKIVASNKLAIDVQRGMLSYARDKYNGTVDGGVKEAPFWVLVGAQMPAVLIELGYLTNDTDLERLLSDYYKALLAKGIMEGIENYFQNN